MEENVVTLSSLWNIWQRVSLWPNISHIYLRLFDSILNVFHLCLLSPCLLKKNLMIKRESLILNNYVNSSFSVFEIHSWPAFSKNRKPDKQESPCTWWFLLILSTLILSAQHPFKYASWLCVHICSWCVAVEPNLFSLQGESFWLLRWCSWAGFPCHFHKGESFSLTHSPHSSVKHIQ